MEDGISILVKPVPAKHPCAISVTAAGIFILAMPEQPEKQYSPKRVTPEGISILVKLRQFEYLQPIITQYFIDNKSEIWLLFLIAHSKR